MEIAGFPRQASIVMNIINVAGDILFIFDSPGRGRRGAGFADQPYDGVCHSGYPPAQYGGWRFCQLRRLRWNSGIIGKILLSEFGRN